jgi:hypothetical protein
MKEDNSEYLQNMLVKLYESFQKEWGSGDVNTMFDEHKTTQAGMRHKGFRVAHMVGSYLDPRFKSLDVFGEGDQEKIKAEVFEQALEVAYEQDGANARRRAAGVAAAVAVAVPEVRLRQGRDQYEAFFSDDSDEDDDNTTAPQNLRLHIPADAVKRTRLSKKTREEMERYSGIERMKRTRTNLDGSKTLINPLDWWRLNVETFPILSQLARRTLCIPASSAPSERLFSHAGLTIANKRASLLPDKAEELIFLHDAWHILGY